MLTPTEHDPRVHSPRSPSPQTASPQNLGFAEYAPAISKFGPPSRFLVRSASALDLNGIARVQTASQRPAASALLLQKVISDSNRELAVALQHNVVVGWAKTHHQLLSDGDTPAGHYLGGVTVRPGSRRQGIADALTAFRLEWIWQRSAVAWYFANQHNLASIDLHKRWGFEEVTRSDSFSSTRFEGGVGILFRANRNEHDVERSSAP
jgi:aminoglycoside 6'-N-acetyltransferase I